MGLVSSSARKRKSCFGKAAKRMERTLIFDTEGVV